MSAEVEVLPGGFTVTQHLFIRAVASGMSVSSAAKAAGVARASTYVWQKDPVFKLVVQEAQQAAIDLVEDALFQLAVNDKNPTALIFFLKNRRPTAWSDRRTLSLEHTSHVDDADAAVISAALRRTLDRLKLPPEQQDLAQRYLAEELVAGEAALEQVALNTYPNQGE